ncbi:hypothetical protein N7510_006561 [Penicillium lagena]|uniref:uncharacterized protein n=1 Tax=Penicillium lagena TaxID=94218 RepID=UPI00253FD939|nr:uncharacterized protein N7510_006561 [Penicillium lagena]KAJ5613367.1 hypothetical protein N7510_006561 [Penicillium lagena]
MARITDAIAKDHRLLESYYETIVRAEDADERTRFQNQFIWELARHSVAEELVVYPAMAKYLRNGDQPVDKDRQGHQTLKERLKNFQDLNCSDPRFIPTITMLMEDLSKHIHDEETMDLVKLEGAITAEESRRLAKSLRRTKIFVPSQAHPEAPDRPPFESAVGLLVAPFDHLRDILRKWPEDIFYPNTSMD